jgi:hypothetical protein
LPVAESDKNQLLRDFRRRSIFDFCNTIEVRADERRAPFDFRKTKGGPWRLATALPSSWEQFASLGRRSSWLRQASPFRVDCFPPAGTIKFNFRKGRPLEQKPWLPSFQLRVRNARSTAARWVRRTAAIRYAVLVRLAFASKNAFRRLSTIGDDGYEDGHDEGDRRSMKLFPVGVDTHWQHSSLRKLKKIRPDRCRSNSASAMHEAQQYAGPLLADPRSECAQD